MRTANEANAGAGGLSAIDAALAHNQSAMAKPRTGKSLKERINSVLDSAAPGMTDNDYDDVDDQGHGWMNTGPERARGVYPVAESRRSPDWRSARSLMGEAVVQGGYMSDKLTYDTANNKDAADYQRSQGIPVHMGHYGDEAEELPQDYRWKNNTNAVEQNLRQQRRGGSGIGGGWG